MRMNHRKRGSKRDILGWGNDSTDIQGEEFGGAQGDERPEQNTREERQESPWRSDRD